MPTSSTSTFELTRDALIRRAFQLAGVWGSNSPLQADDVDMMKDFLGVELDYLHAEGLLQRHATRTTLAVIAGTAAYTLPSDTLEVCVQPGDRFVGTFQQTGSTSESRIYQITAAEYLSITNKSLTSSVPARALVERGATAVTLTLYPKPSVAGTLNYRHIRLVRDADTGGVTIDIPRPLQKGILYALAAEAASAKNAPDIRVSRLLKLSQQFKAAAMGWDRERPPTQFRPYG